jgi:hypothetical protein
MSLVVRAYSKDNEFIINVLERAVSENKAMGRPRLCKSPETQELTVIQQ